MNINRLNITFKGNVELNKNAEKAKTPSDISERQSDLKSLSMQQSNAIKSAKLFNISFKANSDIDEQKHNTVINDVFNTNRKNFDIPARAKITELYEYTKKNNDNLEKVEIKDKNGNIILKATKSSDMDIKVKFTTGKSGLSAQVTLENGINALMTSDSSFKIGDKLSVEMPAENQKKEKISFKGQLYSSNAVSTQGHLVENTINSYVNTNKINESDTSYLKDMNVFIPAAGEGSRLSCLAEALAEGGLPKPVTPSPNGEPLVYNVLDNLNEAGILSGTKKAVNFSEATPMGNLSCVFKGLLSGEIPTNRPLLICSADEVWDVDLKKFVKDFDKKQSGIMVLGMSIHGDRLDKHGIVKINEEEEVESFLEKPGKYSPKADFAKIGEDEYLACTGMYIISPDMLKWIKKEIIKNPDSFKAEDGKSDFSLTLQPTLIDKCKKGEILAEDGRELKFNVHKIPHKFCDIGTFLAYLQTGRDIANSEYKFNDKKISEYRSLVDPDTNVVYMKDAKQEFLSLKDNYAKKGQELKAKGNILIFKA
ncbi:MAG: sugar phosphate nucleotidyltransferase [bacterium]